MKPRGLIARGSIFLIVLSFAYLFLISGCKGEDKGADSSSILTKPLDELTVEDMNKLQAVVETNYGSFVIIFYADKAPKMVKNFIKLVQEGFYDGLDFYQVVPRYWVQGGDPKRDGTGGPGYFIEPDHNNLPREKGTVGMAHPPLAPDQVGSIFYILLDNTYRQMETYPVFGKVIKGMDVLYRISELPNTGPRGKPVPYMPIDRVIIKDIRLEVRGEL